MNDNKQKKDENLKVDPSKPTHVVGIGASAGGLEAIEAFFKAMPTDSGVAFVVVQHLSPDHKSLMVELLSKHTSMLVHRAEDGIEVQKNCVYLIPPNYNLRLFHGRLLLSEQNRENGSINLPIDIFFRSLAEDQSDKGIAIVLSGTGSDGTSGIRAIKEELGMVMAQSEESAAFDGMPHSAIATGLVDFVLDPRDMPNQLLSYLEHPFASPKKASDKLLTNDDGLSLIFSLLREQHKIDFTFYKPSTIIRRIERRMAINQMHELNEYVHFLQGYPEEVTGLYKDLLIGVTSFFRDPEAFAAIRDKLPSLMHAATSKHLRLWVAGCSTGEEAYSLAILCREVMEQEQLILDIKIFATDIDSDATLRASAGIYAESAVAEISPDLVSKYFFHNEDSFQISRQIREMVVFAQHNLTKDPPFTNIDLISCRNLLIYLQPILQKRVLELFNFSLNPQGVLLLGSSETTGDLADYFEPLNHKWRIYQSRGRRRPTEISMSASNFNANRWRNPSRSVGKHPSLQNHEEERVLDRLLQGLSQDYVPFCMVISEDMELIHVIGDSGDYLHFPVGKVINDISKLVTKELSIPLATGIHKVIKSNDQLIYSNIHLNGENGSKIVDMRIRPLPGKRGQIRLISVIIEEVRTEPEHKDTSIENYDVGREAEQRISDLENELQFSRENLQATVEELETSNEELQATNEELLASNEELQSTNEELQSVNEELYTVNSEYQSKIIELTEVNNDLDNLFQNIRVATLFVDESLDIRRFTNAATDLLQIMEQDIGRPLSHITHQFGHLDLSRLAEQVQTSKQALEQDITSNDGHKYLMRIRPYQIAPNHFSGVVLTFFNISDLRQAEEDVANREARMRALLKTIPDGYVLVDTHGKIHEVNEVIQDLTGYQGKELMGQNVALLMSEESAQHHHQHIESYLETGQATIFDTPRQLKLKHKDGRLLPILLTLNESKEGGKHWFIALIHSMPLKE